MAQQLTVNSELTERQRVDTEPKQQEELDTQGFLHSYVFRRAHTDGSLTGEEVRMFDSAASEAVGSQSSNAIEVGRKLAEIGEKRFLV